MDSTCCGRAASVVSPGSAMKYTASCAPPKHTERTLQAPPLRIRVSDDVPQDVVDSVISGMATSATLDPLSEFTNVFGIAPNSSETKYSPAGRMVFPHTASWGSVNFALASCAAAAKQVASDIRSRKIVFFAYVIFVSNRKLGDQAAAARDTTAQTAIDARYRLGPGSLPLRYCSSGRR